MSHSQSEQSFAAIVLAAGEGTRMRSALPKVLHEVAGRPMICHVLAALEPLAPAEIVVVLGRNADKIANAVAPAKTAIQHPPQGTGDAGRAARSALQPAPAGLADIVLLLGDAPLLQSATIAGLLAARRESGAAIALAGMRPADPTPYGRFVLDKDGTVTRIVETKDANPEELEITL